MYSLVVGSAVVVMSIKYLVHKKLVGKLFTERNTQQSKSTYFYLTTTFFRRLTSRIKLPSLFVKD